MQGWAASTGMGVLVGTGVGVLTGVGVKAGSGVPQADKKETKAIAILNIQTFFMLVYVRGKAEWEVHGDG